MQVRYRAAPWTLVLPLLKANLSRLLQIEGDENRGGILAA